MYNNCDAYAKRWSLRILSVAVFIVDYLDTAMAGDGNVAALVADVETNHRHYCAKLESIRSLVNLQRLLGFSTASGGSGIRSVLREDSLLVCFWNILSVVEVVRSHKSKHVDPAGGAAQVY